MSASAGVSDPNGSLTCMSLRRVCRADRPRERAARLGIAALSDRELVAAILGVGRAGQDVLDTATSLLETGLGTLARATVAELSAGTALGPAQATRIAAGFELARRAEAREQVGVSLPDASAIAAVARARLARERQEVVIALLLTARLTLVRAVEVARGACSGVELPTGEVLGLALREGAPRLALAHNHPSGDPRPSATDVRTTRALVALAPVLGLELVDHVVIGRGKRFFSFAEEGQLRAPSGRGRGRGRR